MLVFACKSCKAWLEPFGVSNFLLALLNGFLELLVCGRVEDVVSVLTLVRRGVAQVCHVLRVEELREQLEVEEEEEGKENGQEEEEEVERRRSSQRETTMWMTMDGSEKVPDSTGDKECECDAQRL